MFFTDTTKWPYRNEGNYMKNVNPTGELLKNLENIEVIILSVFQNSMGDWQNITNTRIAAKQLTKLDIPFKEVIGMYNGIKELSFVVTLEQHNRLAPFREILKICGKYKQESILLLSNLQKNNTRLAYLLQIQTPIGEKEYIGLFQQITEEEALKENSYTYDDKANIYYGVK